MQRRELVFWLLCSVLTCGIALGTHFSSAKMSATYPTRNIQGVIMWGAGGATDTMSRAITPYVEPLLDQEIILTNRSGGAGAISTRYVHQRKPDGYTLLYGAENPQLHGVLGLSDVDYSEFYAVNVLARGISVIVAHPDTPWRT